jgi:hypothetical protein
MSRRPYYWWCSVGLAVALGSLPGCALTRMGNRDLAVYVYEQCVEGTVSNVTHELRGDPEVARGEHVYVNSVVLATGRAGTMSRTDAWCGRNRRCKADLRERMYADWQRLLDAQVRCSPPPLWEQVDAGGRPSGR